MKSESGFGLASPFEKWKWTDCTADQLKSAGNLTTCVPQKQLIYFFTFYFYLIIIFHLIIKPWQLQQGSSLLCRATGSSRERQFWGRNRTDRACLAPSLETKMEEFFQIKLFPGPLLRQIRRRKFTSKQLPDFLSSHIYMSSYKWQIDKNVEWQLWQLWYQEVKVGTKHTSNDLGHLQIWHVGKHLTTQKHGSMLSWKTIGEQDSRKLMVVSGGVEAFDNPDEILLVKISS